jgi:proteic killer suppression protein
MAIRCYRDRRTASFVEGERVREFEECKKQAAKGIMRLQSATRLIDLRSPPSNVFQALGGDRLGEYSIRVSQRWRLCFRWAFLSGDDGEMDLLLRPGEPYDVEISDHYD